MARRSSDSPVSLSAPAPGASRAAPRRRPDARAARAGPDFSREAALLAAGARAVAGIDEAGRGPLAGPVVAAAVVLQEDAVPAGLDDSKALTAPERERLFAEILARGRVSFSAASPAEIDRLNIRGATLLAMRRALAGLAETPCHAIIDGRDVPAGLACRGQALVSGDALSLSVAAASIVAKVMRDRMMRRACLTYAGYGFSRHMGYGTPEHLDALRRLGPCPIHRRSFAPLRLDLLSGL
ncbi:ribonuclease HII [Aurantimonas sp. Leaf443]|nr:ribonuclease HII [Aurantimonas sp. Leaf443]